MQDRNYHWVREIEFEGEDLHCRTETNPYELREIIDEQASEIRTLKNFIYEKNLLMEYNQYKENIRRRISALKSQFDPQFTN